MDLSGWGWAAPAEFPALKNKSREKIYCVPECPLYLNSIS